MLLFETFTPPRAFMASPSLLSLLATGNSTGLVVDSGHTHTTCVPVYAGFPLAHATRSLPVGGRDIASNLGSTLQVSLAENTLLDMKENFCRVALDPFQTIKQKQWEEQQYTLPDGQVLSIGMEALYAPEPLFAPFLGLGSTVSRIIDLVDKTVQNDLWRGIVLVSSRHFLSQSWHCLQCRLKRG